jgi:ribosome-binding protein aMBF1 (putative translation factor)
MPRTRDALKILDPVTGSDDGLRRDIAKAKVTLDVAQMIYDARTKAGLSQRELAALIGSKQPVIARLEDASYEGHSLTMLRRIADALEQGLEIRFVPRRSRKRAGRPGTQDPAPRTQHPLSW